MHPAEPSCTMQAHVHLPNGDGCSVEVSAATRISQLTAVAQQHFQRRLKLTAKGRQLHETATLSEAALQDGDVVLAVAQLGKLAATGGAFALHGRAGETVTWGHPVQGGDSRQVKEQLRNVQHIQATKYAFAAILESGTAARRNSS